jgi:hypothetical protein
MQQVEAEAAIRTNKEDISKEIDRINATNDET